MTDDTLDRDLIEIFKHEDEYGHLQDDIDESRCLYLINAILSGTARLNVLLPSATVLAFTIFAPLLTDDGRCSSSNRWLTGIFLAICAASCVFSAITDSFRTATGRLYYGVATFRGIWTFNGSRRKPCVPSDYRLRWMDFFYSSLSLIAFLTFAALHGDVVACYYPKMPKKLTNILPLVVGFAVSVIFVIFPSRRRGIGYPFLLQREAFIECKHFQSGNLVPLIPLMDCFLPVALGNPSSMTTPGTFTSISHSFSLTTPPGEHEDVIPPAGMPPTLSPLKKVQNLPLPRVILISILLSEPILRIFPPKLHLRTECRKERDEHHIRGSLIPNPLSERPAPHPLGSLEVAENPVLGAVLLDEGVFRVGPEIGGDG